MNILGRSFFDKAENKVQENKSSKTLLKKILLQQKYRMREDLRTFELAIENRRNIVNYNREDIHRLYRKAMQDAHIRSQWTTRKLKTLKKEFFVMPENDTTPNDDLTQALQKPWFFDFLDKALDSMAWGFSLIEFGMWDGTKFIPYRMNKGGLIHEDLEIIDRDNVKPELGLVVNTPGESTGDDFTDNKYNRNVIFIGGQSDGWLFEATKPYLIKDNTLKNWSEFAELFGMDIRAMKTEAEGSARTDLINSLKRAVGGGSVVMGLEDSLEYIGTGRSDAHNVFQQLTDGMDKAISKLIFGQDVVSNNTGRVVGEVGENVSNIYSDADARFLKFVIEDKLFPLLTLNGLNFEGMTFEWGTKESLSLVQRADIDLKVSQMGFGHSPKYINETYDTDVSDESVGIKETQKKLQNIYNEKG